MKELSPDAQSVIESAAGLDDPRPADRERVRRAVMAVVGAGAGLGGATAAGSAAAASAATSAAAGTGSAIGAGIGAGGVLELIGWVVVGAGVGFSLPLPSAESATQAPD